VSHPSNRRRRLDGWDTPEKWLSSWSEKRQKKLEQRKAAYRLEVESLSKDPTDLIFRFILATFGLIFVVVSGGFQLILLFVASSSSLTSRIKTTLSIVGFIFLIVHFALGKWAYKRGRQCIEANYLRRETRLEGEKTANEPATTSAKRDDHESVSRS
jgi:energy-converting hydrogenase Eha subunit C